MTVEQIIINDNPEKKESGQHILQSVNSGLCYEGLLDSLRQSESNPHGLDGEEVSTFRIETVDILNHCNPHDAVMNIGATHLAFGYVQSGKTMSFTGVTALAIDNGYRIIVYFTGTKNNLLEQTANRLKKDFGKVRALHDMYKIHVNPGLSDVGDILGHYNLSDKPAILIPILKRYDHIDDLSKIFQTDGFQTVLQRETVIIIDDESDQASLNSYGRKNSKDDGNDKMSRTYEAIFKLRAELPGNSYIQYTATPQANILISMQDLLSPKSHTVLTPGKNYIGGRLFFGKGANHDLFNGRMVLEIPPTEVFHKKKNPLKAMPESLRDALAYHIIAVAVVVKWKKTKGVDFLSMMVHPDNTIKWNKTFKTWVDRTLESWRKILTNREETDNDRMNLVERFQKIFPSAIELYDKEERPSFEEILPLIQDVINDKKVYLVNTDKDAETIIDWKSRKMHILVGAEMLNRGFTIENLATTYMPRYTTGATNADTIQQRCRFFGYKRDYIRSCRVFLPEISIRDYCDYVDHEEELRTTLKSCDNLIQAERKVLLSPRLRPTRKNILPIWVVQKRLCGMFPMQAFSTKEIIDANTRLCKGMLSRHVNDFNINYEYGTADRNHRGLRLSIEEAISFLGDFQFGNWKDAMRKSSTIRYLRYLSAEDRPEPLQYVYFIQMAFGGDPRERDFDKNTGRLSENTQLFAGRSPSGTSVYPGDTKIVGHDSITIQLHHLKLKNATLDYGDATAYTLAINYPKEFSALYYTNERSRIDDNDDETINE